MQKNEGGLLESWIQYHGRLAAYQDIIIVDNGSTDPETIRVLDRAERLGVVVDRAFASKADFDQKHAVMSGKIAAAQQTGQFDFIFPLDADEFLVLAADDQTALVDIESIGKELRPHLAANTYFRMAGAFYNNPAEPGGYFFYREPGVFFGRDLVATLDLGYHLAASQSGEPPVTARIAVVHFQHKRLEVAKTHAVEKLKSRIEDFGHERLKGYSGVGSHMVKYFFTSPEDYSALFAGASRTRLPDFATALHSLGEIFPYDILFATDRYAAFRQEVENSELREQIMKEGTTIEELLLIHKYTRWKARVTVYREAVLVPFLLRNHVRRVTVIGNNRAKMQRISEAFGLEAYRSAERFRFQHFAMGETDEMGFPTGAPETELIEGYSVESPKRVDPETEVLIANGRYRVAVLLGCTQVLNPECIYILPNFWTRPHYHAVLPFFDVVDNEGDAVILRRTSVMKMDRFCKVLADAIHDNR
jgi:hypothetical protein